MILLITINNIFEVYTLIIYSTTTSLQVLSKY